MYIENIDTIPIEGLVLLLELSIFNFREIKKIIKEPLNIKIEKIKNIKNKSINNYKYNILYKNYLDQIKKAYKDENIKKNLEKNNITDIYEYYQLFSYCFLKEIKDRIINNYHYTEFKNNLSYINFSYPIGVIEKNKHYQDLISNFNLKNIQNKYQLPYVHLLECTDFRKILNYYLNKDLKPNEIEQYTRKRILNEKNVQNNISIDFRNITIKPRANKIDFKTIYNEFYYYREKECLENIKGAFLIGEENCKFIKHNLFDVRSNIGKYNLPINSIIETFTTNDYKIPINLDIEKLINNNISRYINISPKFMNNNIKDFFLKEHNHYYINLYNIIDLHEAIDEGKDKIEIIKNVLLSLLKDLDNSKLIHNLTKLYEIKKETRITTKDLKIEDINLAYVCDNLLNPNSLEKNPNTLITFNNVSINPAKIKKNFCKFFIILGFKDFKEYKWKSYYEVEQISVKINTFLNNPDLNNKTKKIRRFIDMFLDKHNKIYNNDTFCWFINKFKKKTEEYYIKLNNKNQEKKRINFRDYTLWYVYFSKIYNLLKNKESWLRKKIKIEPSSNSYNDDITFFYLKIYHIITINIFFDFLNYLDSFNYFNGCIKSWPSSSESESEQKHVFKKTKKDYSNNIEKLGIFLENGLMKEETLKELENIVYELYNYQLNNQRNYL